MSLSPETRFKLRRSLIILGIFSHLLIAFGHFFPVFDQYGVKTTMEEVSLRGGKSIAAISAAIFRDYMPALAGASLLLLWLRGYFLCLIALTILGSIWLAGLMNFSILSPAMLVIFSGLLLATGSIVFLLLFCEAVEIKKQKQKD